MASARELGVEVGGDLVYRTLLRFEESVERLRLICVQRLHHIPLFNKQRLREWKNSWDLSSFLFSSLLFSSELLYVNLNHTYARAETLSICYCYWLLKPATKREREGFDFLQSDSESSIAFSQLPTNFLPCHRIKIITYLLCKIPWNYFSFLFF